MPEFLQIKHFVIVPDDFGWGNISLWYLMIWIRRKHEKITDALLFEKANVGIVSTAAFLSVSGGLQDMYTYISRGHVFANAQTGNIVLLSQHIFAGNWADVMRYLMPVLSFMFGVAAATEIRQHFQNIGRIHWRQIVILIEMSMLFLVGFLPGKMDLVANAFVSFSCAMQVQTFRKVDSYAFASTMCIGNIRSGMEALCAYRQSHNRQILYKAFHYFGIIILFAFGAGIGSILIPVFNLQTIWFSSFLLMVGFFLMFIQEK